ncbi:hypothetical protein ACQCSX_03330 [Pseudarthrobacter sp. P1]|uniref:hypothetical protein n=1 Tax=Pseudarthrobacter sp. P1 TaxID=3418418 RepID=UPI003CF29AD0
MFFDRSHRPQDAPAPPTPDEVAAGFPVPLLTLVPQDTVEEAGAGLNWETGNGRLEREAATLSYTLWRHPADRGDPANLAVLSAEVQASLDVAPPWPLPPWITAWRARMRYPLLWDAVRTTHINDGSGRPTAETALVQHINYIVENQYRAERVAGGFPGKLREPATAQQLDHDVPILVDGVRVPGLRLGTDPHVLGLAADLGDRLLTAVVGREYLPYLRLEFATRPSRPTE